MVSPLYRRNGRIPSYIDAPLMLPYRDVVSNKTKLGVILFVQHPTHIMRTTNCGHQLCPKIVETKWLHWNNVEPHDCTLIKNGSGTPPRYSFLGLELMSRGPILINPTALCELVSFTISFRVFPGARRGRTMLSFLTSDQRFRCSFEQLGNSSHLAAFPNLETCHLPPTYQREGWQLYFTRSIFLARK